MTFEGLRVEPSGAIVAYLPAGVVRLVPDETDKDRASGWYDWSWREVEDPTEERGNDLDAKLNEALRRADAIGANERWITMPGGGRGGSPVLVEGTGPSAVVKGGAGGKFTGKTAAEIKQQSTSEPPKQEPPKQEPPKQEPPKQELRSVVPTVDVNQYSKLSQKEFREQYGLQISGLMNSPEEKRSVLEIRAGVAAIPKTHRKLLSDVHVRPVDEINVADAPSGAVGLYSKQRGVVQVARNFRVGSKSYKVKGQHAVVVHELGHALDARLGDASRSLVAGSAYEKMTSRERDNAKYYTTNQKELWSECYAVAFSPKIKGETDQFFGLMSRDRANEVFGDTIERMKKIIDERTRR